MFKKILVCYDGSEGAEKALNNAVEITKMFNSRLVAMWVGGYRPYYHERVAEIEEENRAIESFSSKLRKKLKEKSNLEGIEIEYAHMQGNPAKLIVEYAERNYFDVIIIGSGGHSELWGNSLGHVTDKVSENSKTNVLIVRN